MYTLVVICQESSGRRKTKFIFGFDNNVTNIFNNRTIFLVVMELGLWMVMEAVEVMLFSLDRYKLVVLDHCHWTINLKNFPSELNVLNYESVKFDNRHFEVFEPFLSHFETVF